jgi:hypothetical protein
VRTLFLGDWRTAPWLRDPIDLLRATFLAGAVVFALVGDAKGVANLLVSSVAVIVARLVDLPRVYDLAFVVAMALTGWGEALGLYDRLRWYDDVVHLVVPMLTCQVAYIALARLDVVPDPRDETPLKREWGIALTTFALGVAVAGLWEIVEFGSDELLGSELQLSNADTSTDLIAGALGSALGAAGLVLWTTRGWGSVRRIPGENRFEDVSA